MAKNIATALFTIRGHPKIIYEYIFSPRILHFLIFIHTVLCLHINARHISDIYSRIIIEIFKIYGTKLCELNLSRKFIIIEPLHITHLISSTLFRFKTKLLGFTISAQQISRSSGDLIDCLYMNRLKHANFFSPIL